MGDAAFPMFPDLPDELFYGVSQDALLLYLCIKEACASSKTGYCDGVWYAGALAGLRKKRFEGARDELIAQGFIEVFKVPGMYSPTRDAARLAGRKALPARLDRLPPDAWSKLRQATFLRDNFTCQYCGDQSCELECDHVEPISKGGTNELGNLITACSECNRSKRGKLLHEWHGRRGAMQ
jgi:hypothetical protein